MDKLISSEELLLMLQRTENNAKVEVKSMDIKPLSETSKGLVGEHFIVTVQYVLENDTEVISKRYFLKHLTKTEGTMYNMAVSIKAYDKEHFFYETFLEECKKHSQVLDSSFAPKYYLSDVAKFKVVLEDLSIKGFKNTPSKETLDLAHTKVAMEALAKFHGASIICEERADKVDGKPLNFGEKYPTEVEEILFSRKQNLGTKWFKCSIDGLKNIIDVIPEDGVPRETFKKKIEEAFDNLFDIVQPSKKLRNSLTHGDLWTNNFMYRYENGIPVECILIDFQLLKYSPPCLDVVQLIITNTRKSLRDVHWRELLDHYYDHLKTVLEAASLDIATIVPYEDYLESSYLFKIPAKMQAIADRSITFLSETALAEVLTSSENFENFLFKDRSQSMIQSFQTNELFKEILGEDIVELRDLLMHYTK